MSRLVQPGSSMVVQDDVLMHLQSFAAPGKGRDLGAELKKAVQKGEKGDNYTTRVAKYVPTEILAAYITLLGVVDSMVGSSELKFWLYLAALAIGVVFTPIYFYMAAEKNDPRAVQMIVSTLAFLVWAYSLEGFFKAIGIHHPAVASFALILFTLISGAIKPNPAKA